jgi:apolipoprotein N-acyltransferase
MIAILCTLLSAAGFYFSFGLGDCWPLAWLAAIPVLWLAFGESRALVVFFAAWASFALGSCHAIEAYGALFPTFVMALLILGPALFFAASVMAARRIAIAFGPTAGAFGFAAVWTACDFLTAAFHDGAVTSPAHTQISAPFLIQGASVFGLWIVTFLLGFFAAGIAAALRTRKPLPAALAVALVALNAAFGVWRIDAAATGPVTRVGMAVDDSLFHDSHVAAAASANRVADAYVGAARKLAAQGASLIVFPEKVAFLHPQWRQSVADKLAAVSREIHATIVTGFDETARDRVNEALVFTPDAAPRTYAKRHFVTGLEDHYKTGPGPLVLPGGIGVEICKDMDYPAMLRADQRAGHPTLLAVPAWDFRSDALAHTKPAIMRGVEDGFALARSARESLLTMTDAYGRVIGMKESSTAGMAMLVGDIPRGPGDTLYVHIGDIFAWTCAAASLILLGAAFARRR